MKFLLAVIALLAFGTAHADDDRSRFPMDLGDLGLSPKQHKSVEAAMREYQHAYRRHHRQSEKTHEELTLLFLAPSFDEEAFRSKNMEIARASAEIRTKLFGRLHAILTPEQKRRFSRHLEEWESE